VSAGEEPMRLQVLLRLGVAGAVIASSGFAAAPTIGVATAVGTFKVNSSEVDGNANIFEGAEIRTANAASQIFLQNGSAVTFAVNSAGVLYRDHLVLQQGATKVENMPGYTIQAGAYRVQGEPKSQAVVRFQAGEVQVASLSGSLNVMNARGALLTRIGAGTASSFNKDPQAGQSGAPVNTENRAKDTTLYLLLVASLGGLGLAVDAIVQPGTKTQVSP
jgi:hypothetical protein